MNPNSVELKGELDLVATSLRLQGVALFRATAGQWTEVNIAGTFPQETANSQTRWSLLTSLPRLSTAQLPSASGFFALSVGAAGKAEYLILAHRTLPTGRFFHKIDTSCLASLRERSLEAEVYLLNAQARELSKELELASTSSNALLASFKTADSTPPFEVTLSYLLQLFSLEHGSIWELHDESYLTLEAVTNCDVEKYTHNCLPRSNGLVWRALVPGSPKVQELRDLKPSDLANDHLIDLYREREIYLLRLGDPERPYGVACLVGREPHPPEYNNTVLQTFEQFLALELRSRRQELTTRLFGGIQNIFSRDAKDIPTLCMEIGRELLQLIDCQAISVAIKVGLDPKSTKLRLVSSDISSDQAPSSDLERFRSGDSIIYDVGPKSLTGSVAIGASSRISNEVSADVANSFTYREVASHSNDTWMGVPILTGAKECIGVIRCSGKMTQIGHARLNYIFDSVDQSLVASAAATLAPLLQHKQVTEELRIVNERLENTDRIRQHEMRGPLQLIASQAEFVLKRLDDSAATSKPRRLETIITNVNLCTTLLSSASTLPSAQRFKLELEELDLRKLLLALSEVLRHQIEARSPSIISEDSSTGELLMISQPYMIVELQGTCSPVFGHRDLLQRAFYNIASNAVKYAKRSEKGRLIIGLEQTHDPEGARITFRDFGIGVTEDESQRIFEGRYRGRESMHRPGEGLGLKIAKAIVELHQGSLRLTSRSAPTVFEVVIPKVISATR